MIEDDKARITAALLYREEWSWLAKVESGAATWEQLPDALKSRFRDFELVRERQGKLTLTKFAKLVLSIAGPNYRKGLRD